MILVIVVNMQGELCKQEIELRFGECSFSFGLLNSIIKEIQ